MLPCTAPVSAFELSLTFEQDREVDDVSRRRRRVAPTPGCRTGRRSVPGRATSRAPRTRPRWRSCSPRRPGAGFPRERSGDGPEARPSGCRRHERRRGRSRPASRSACPASRAWKVDGSARAGWQPPAPGSRWPNEAALPAFLPGRPNRGRRARSGTTCLQERRAPRRPRRARAAVPGERRCERAVRRRRGGLPPPRRPRAPGASLRAGRCPSRASAASAIGQHA